MMPPTTSLLLLRIKFPDGALLMARFYEGERVAVRKSVLRLVGRGGRTWRRRRRTASIRA